MKGSETTHLPPPKPQTTATADRDQPRRRTPLRRRVTSPAFLSRKRVAAASKGGGGRRSGPVTPLLRWKFDDAGVTEDSAQEDAVEVGDSAAVRKPRNSAAAAVPVSARRLAAGIWQLQLPEVGGGVRRLPGRKGVEPVLAHLQSPHLCNPKAMDQYRDSNDESQSPASFANSESGAFLLEPSMAFPNHAMERATKWDPGFSKASEEVYRLYGHMKSLEDQQVTAISIVSILRGELEQARARINHLEDDRRSSKKKLDHFLRKVAEEKAAWRSREHEKVCAVIDSMKDDLSREKKYRQRMETVNSKLVNELTEAKLSAKRYLQDYEKERKARELMEEVCDELAKEIGEEREEVEALKKESAKIRDEMDEERRMLQMAEVWREERVQMKLVDAKLALEEKYVQLSHLEADLLAFLRARSGTTSSVEDIREAELLIDAVNSVRINEMEEFSYQPPHESEDIFSLFEQLQPEKETHEREREPCYGCSPASHTSKIRTVSPEFGGFNENPMLMCGNGTADRTGDNDDDSGWETVSHVEEHESSDSPDGSDAFVNGAYLESNGSVSGVDFDETADGKARSEISEAYSATTKLSRKKSSSIAKLWRSSVPSNGESYKIVAVDVMNGRLSNRRTSNETDGTLSPDRGCGEVGFSSPSAGQWSSPDSINPHVTRGMKGCIEWPTRGMQKQSLKAKLFEARMESQKIQLRHVLKQKS